MNILKNMLVMFLVALLSVGTTVYTGGCENESGLEEASEETEEAVEETGEGIEETGEEVEESLD